MLDAIPSTQELFSVTGKVAIVTGATGGLGKVACLALAKAGAKVVLTGRSVDSLAPLTEMITNAGYTATHIAGDPVSHDDNKRIVAHAVETYGGLDIVLTAAGVNKPAPIVEQSVEDWENIMDVNVKGTYLMCKEAGKVLIQQGRGGKVILVSSQRGKLGLPNYSAYCPSKGAIDSLTQTLAWEWGKHHINVNAIAPTVFRTGLTQWIFESPEVTQRFLARMPIGRLGEPEDYVGSVLFLSSRASDLMTGAILYVDGGYTAG